MRYFGILLIILLAGCADQTRQSEDYGMTTVADLTLTSDNHPHGYTRSECFLCHIPANIHQVNRLKAPSFDIAKQLVEQSGLSSCRGCHGSNGVTP